MSSLFGGGSMPTYQAPAPQYQAKEADLSAENASLFERIQRSRAYGPTQTRLVPGVKTAWGGA